jgi:hypothetical protein
MSDGDSNQDNGILMSVVGNACVEEHVDEGGTEQK